MADGEMLKRCMNPVILSLQKMELELKCPACLELLDMPVMLPCTHIFCSHCISTLTKNGCECPSCKSHFLHQDLTPASHIKPLVNIYKEMISAVAAIFPLQNANETFENKMPTRESPVSGNNYVKEDSSKKFSELQMHTSNVSQPSLGKSNEFATQKSKKRKQSHGEEVRVVNTEQYSPPSFGSNKDSDGDNSNNANERLEFKKSKGQKLNMESADGDKDGIKMNGLEHNQKNSPDTPQLETSRYSSAVKIFECMFCHSFRTTEASGKMRHFLNEKEVGMEQAAQPGVFHVHEKCIDWAPQIYYSGDKIINLEVELARASKIKCSKCNMKGAALGCYVKSCRRSYHVPCAYNTIECRWDCENYLVLCPAHSSSELPCDKSNTKSKNKAKSTLEYSSPSTDLTSNQWNKDWVFCGSALSREEKLLLEKFASISGANVTDYWEPSVSHVIASVDDNGGCSRTLKFLMSILAGKWVLTIEWIKACLRAGHPVPEEHYEVTHDVHGCFDGPRTGRLRAMQKAPKLLDGLRFYITDDFQQSSFKKYIEDLISTGGGSLVKLNDLKCGQHKAINSSNIIIVYSAELPLTSTEDINEVTKQRSEGAEALAADVGGIAIPHTTFLDNIAACQFE